MRQEIRHLVHQVDAQFVIIDADVDVHAADQQSSRRGLHLDGKGPVPVFFRLLLFGPAAEGVRGCRNRRHAVIGGDVDDDAAQPAELDFRFLDVVADLGADLDLRTQEFRGHLSAAAFLALSHETVRRVDNQAARLPVDEQVLLLDADGERGTATVHRLSTPSARIVRRTSLDLATRSARGPGRKPVAILPRPRRRQGRCRSGPGESLWRHGAAPHLPRGDPR